MRGSGARWTKDSESAVRCVRHGKTARDIKAGHNPHIGNRRVQDPFAPQVPGCNRRANVFIKAV